MPLRRLPRADAEEGSSEDDGWVPDHALSQHDTATLHTSDDEDDHGKQDESQDNDNEETPARARRSVKRKSSTLAYSAAGDDEQNAFGGIEFDAHGFERGASLVPRGGSLDWSWRYSERFRRDHGNRYHRRKRIAGTNLEQFSDDEGADEDDELDAFIVDDDGNDNEDEEDDKEVDACDEMAQPGAQKQQCRHLSCQRESVHNAQKPMRLDDEDDDRELEAAHEFNTSRNASGTSFTKIHSNQDAAADVDSPNKHQKRKRRSSLKRADGFVPCKHSEVAELDLQGHWHSQAAGVQTPPHDACNGVSTDNRSPGYNTYLREKQRLSESPEQTGSTRSRRVLDDDNDDEENDEGGNNDVKQGIYEDASGNRRKVRKLKRVSQSSDNKHTPPGSGRLRESQRSNDRKATQRDALERLRKGRQAAHSLEERLELAGVAQDASDDNEKDDEEDDNRGRRAHYPAPELADDRDFVVADFEDLDRETDSEDERSLRNAGPASQLKRDLPSVATRKADAMESGRLHEFLISCCKLGYPKSALAVSLRVKHGSPSVASAAASELLLNGMSDAAAELLRRHGAESFSLRWKDSGSGETIAHKAAASGSAECVAAISDLAKGSSSDKHNAILRSRDASNATPLMVAAGSGCRDAVDELLRRLGSEARQAITEKDDQMRTPMHWAANIGNASTIRLLALKDSNTVFAKDSQGATPLHHACAEHGYADCVQALIHSGAPVAAPDARGFPPLLYADFTARRNCVLTLLSYECDKQLVELSSLMEDPAARPMGVSVLQMLAEIPSYYDKINKFVEENPALLSSSLSWMLHTSILSFNVRRQWLRRQIRSTEGERELSIPGDTITAGSLSELSDQVVQGYLTREMLRSIDVPLWLRLSMPDAPTSGGPGVERELLGRVAQNAIDRGLLIEQESSQRTYSIAALPHDDDAAFCFGLMVGYAVRHDSSIPITLAPSALRALQGKKLTVEDLENEDPRLFKSMRLIESMEDASILDLTFDDVDIRGSSSRAVNNSNKREYTQKMIKRKVQNANATMHSNRNIQAFAQGVHDVVGKRLLTPFSPGELALLVGGSADVDVDEWQAYTTYEGYDATQDPQPTWLWNCIRNEMQREERLLLLKFATGSSRLPPGGFAELQGSDDSAGDAAFCIARMSVDDDNQTLPQASTCTRRLMLPAYSTEQALHERLLVAVRHGSEGFSFA